jgi:hypothetical protein
MTMQKNLSLGQYRISMMNLFSMKLGVEMKGCAVSITGRCRNTSL